MLTWVPLYVPTVAIHTSLKGAHRIIFYLALNYVQVTLPAEDNHLFPRSIHNKTEDPNPLIHPSIPAIHRHRSIQRLCLSCKTYMSVGLSMPRQEEMPARQILAFIPALPLKVSTRTRRRESDSIHVGGGDK